MKKLFLVATIGAVGLCSAKTIKSNNDSDLKANDKKETVLKHGNKKTLKTTASKQTLCGVVYTTCIVAATTCQDWSDAQWIAWAEAIQENYC